ncbi:MAG TPA: hypothetical protein VFQ73_09390 [Flavisolibacter sp.]|nr:hypothetical protein [Flavisolibacter sp.]
MREPGTRSLPLTGRAGLVETGAFSPGNLANADEASTEVPASVADFRKFLLFCDCIKNDL